MSDDQHLVGRPSERLNACGGSVSPGVIPAAPCETGTLRIGESRTDAIWRTYRIAKHRQDSAWRAYLASQRGDEDGEHLAFAEYEDASRACEHARQAFYDAVPLVEASEDDGLP